MFRVMYRSQKSDQKSQKVAGEAQLQCFLHCSSAEVEPSKCNNMDKQPSMLTTAISASRRLLASKRGFLVSSKLESFSRQLSFPAKDLGITVEGILFPYIWLRDACQCPFCVHPSTSQKLHRTSDIDVDIKPSSDGIRYTDEGVHVEWMTGHKSFYATAFLERHSSPFRLSVAHKDVPQISWDVSYISQAPHLFLPYKSLHTPSGLLAGINQLSQLGLLVVTGVPNVESSSQTCELRKLAQLFGEIRDTFYGELWDVRNVRNAQNIAYTNLDLGLHMDLLYVCHPKLCFSVYLLYLFVFVFVLQLFRASASLSNSSLLA